MAVNLKSIADEVGISVSTTSMALSDHPRISEDTKERVRRVSLALGYCTREELEARRIQQRRKRQLRIQLLTQPGRLPDRMHSQLLTSLMANPPRDSVRLELASPADHSTAALTAHLREEGEHIDGLLLTNMITEEHLQILIEHDMPAVVIGPLKGGRPVHNLDACRQLSVGMDEITTGCRATEQLLGLGHRRIALVSAPGVDGMYYDRWLNGYRLALAKASLPIDPELIDLSEGLDIQVCDLEEPPTAFICPEINYVRSLRHVALSRGLRFDPGNVIISTNSGQLQQESLEDYPAYLVPVDLLMQEALRRLQELVCGPPGPWVDLRLPHRPWQLDRLESP